MRVDTSEVWARLALVGSALEAIDVSDPVELPPPPPFARPTRDTIPIEDWRQFVYKPGMSESLLFVLLPVLDAIMYAETEEELVRAREGLLGWSRTTQLQRMALSTLFEWIFEEILRPGSVIPEHIRSMVRGALADAS